MWRSYNSFALSHRYGVKHFLQIHRNIRLLNPLWPLTSYAIFRLSHNESIGWTERIPNWKKNAHFEWLCNNREKYNETQHRPTMFHKIICKKGIERNIFEVKGQVKGKHFLTILWCLFQRLCKTFPTDYNVGTKYTGPQITCVFLQF